MIWHAIAETGAGVQRMAGADLPDAIRSGTILCEIDTARLLPDGGPLLHAGRRGPQPFLLSLGYSEDGRLRVVHRKGAQVLALSVGIGGMLAAGILRVSYHWDAGAGTATLTAEDPGRGAILQSAGVAPPPLDADDALALAGSVGAGTVRSVAIGSGRHPIGAGACFGGDTPVMTPDGPVAARLVRAGDRVVTDAGPRDVLWSGHMTVPGVGSFRPIRLCTPYFGATADLLVPPHARVALGGPEVEYLFDTEEVLVEARHLAADRTAVTEADGAGLVTWHGLLLEEPRLIHADGAWIESVYVGRLAASPDVARTTALGALAAEGRLPVHRRPVRRELCDFEAATLVLNMSQRRSPVAA